MRRIVVTLLVLTLSGCYFQTIRHSPAQAAADTNTFLKALYIDHDYQQALDLGDDALRKAATVQDLEKLVQMIEESAGQLEELRADSYQQAPGKTLELFYTGGYKKATLYHHLVLSGDASSGYKVSGVWFKDSPYPENPLRHPFPTNIVVK